jgi:hypothetical protein
MHSFSSTLAVVMPISANVAGPFLGGPFSELIPTGGVAASGRLSRLGRPSRRGGPNDVCEGGGRGLVAEPDPGSERLYRGALAKGLGD